MSNKNIINSWEDLKVKLSILRGISRIGWDNPVLFKNKLLIL